jgi:hypothetical protein
MTPRFVSWADEPTSKAVDAVNVSSLGPDEVPLQPISPGKFVNLSSQRAEEGSGTAGPSGQSQAVSGLALCQVYGPDQSQGSILEATVDGVSAADGV